MDPVAESPSEPWSSLVVEKCDGQAERSNRPRADLSMACERLGDVDTRKVLPYVNDAGDSIAGRSTLHAGDIGPMVDISEDRLSRAVESAPDGLLMIDDSGRIMMVNHQIETMFGYDHAELLGRGVELLLPERFRKVHSAHRLRYQAGHEIRSMGIGLNLRANRRDGTEFPVEISLSLISDRDGSAVVACVETLVTEWPPTHTGRGSRLRSSRPMRVCRFSRPSRSDSSRSTAEESSRPGIAPRTF